MTKKNKKERKAKNYTKQIFKTTQSTRPTGATGQDKCKHFITILHPGRLIICVFCVMIHTT